MCAHVCFYKHMHERANAHLYAYTHIYAYKHTFAHTHHHRNHRYHYQHITTTLPAHYHYITNTLPPLPLPLPPPYHNHLHRHHCHHIYRMLSCMCTLHLLKSPTLAVTVNRPSNKRAIKELEIFTPASGRPTGSQPGVSFPHQSAARARYWLVLHGI